MGIGQWSGLYNLSQICGIINIVIRAKKISGRIRTFSEIVMVFLEIILTLCIYSLDKVPKSI